MCPHCRAFITTKDKVCPYCDTAVGPRAADRLGAGDLLGGLIPSAQFATVTILTACVGMYLVTMLASAKVGEVNALIRYGAALPEGVFGGQWWRLITAGFLHGNLMHIGFNLWALMDVGRHAEEVYGAKRMVVIYIASTIGGFLLSMLRGTMLTVGASAGLFGLIGAMIALGLRHKWSAEASAIKAFYLRWAIYGLLWGLLPFFRVDNAAHIGGLMTGLAVGYVAGTPREFDKLREQIWTALAVGSIALTGYAYLRLVLWLTAA
jgi:rhomboid protease GluP